MPCLDSQNIPHLRWRSCKTIPVVSVPVAAVTGDGRQGFQPRDFTASQAGGQESDSKVPAAGVFREAPGAMWSWPLSSFCCCWQSSGLLGLETHHSHLCLCLHTAFFSVSLRVSSRKRTPVVGFRTHPQPGGPHLNLHPNYIFRDPTSKWHHIHRTREEDLTKLSTCYTRPLWNLPCFPPCIQTNSWDRARSGQGHRGPH